LRSNFACAIVDRQSGQRRMGFGGFDIFRCGVDACDGRAHAGQRFAQQTRAAPNVQRALARQRCP